MSWSISLGKIAGSEIRIHLTFLLLLLWIGIAGFAAGGAAEALDSVVYIVAVFACVTLHELGHALAARRYGIDTPDITLLPIGGLARLSRIPEKPSEEVIIALAGPAVNVVIALVLIVVVGARFDPQTIGNVENPSFSFAARLASVNIILVLFNLIPAFPMDGGRVLRALLAMRMSRRRATEIAAKVGQAAAFAFGFAGLLAGNPLLVFVAVFVYLAAAAEAGDVGLMELGGRLPVERAMIRTFETLGVQATAAMAAEALLRTTQHEFPIVDGGGRLRGFLTRETLMLALRKGPETSVLEAMVPAVTVSAGERLAVAIRKMQEEGTQLIGVNGADGRFAGYVSGDNLSELMMLESLQAPSAAGAAKA